MARVRLTAPAANTGTSLDGYKVAAECGDGPRRIQNYTEIGRTVPELSKKVKHDYKTAAECWDSHRTGTSLVRLVPKLGQKGKHNYKTAAVYICIYIYIYI